MYAPQAFEKAQHGFYLTTPVLDRHLDGDLDPRLHAELHQDMCNVIRDGAGREHEALRDLLIGEPLRDQLGYLPLASRERLGIAVRVHLDFSGCETIFHTQPSVRGRVRRLTRR